MSDSGHVFLHNISFVTFPLQPCSINPDSAKLFQLLKYFPLCFGKMQGSPTHTFQTLSLFFQLLSLWLFLSFLPLAELSSSNPSHSETLLPPSFKIVYLVVLHSQQGVALLFWLVNGDRSGSRFNKFQNERLFGRTCLILS